MRPLANHPESLLYGFLKAAPDGHDLAHALHAGADLAGHAVELGEVPARNLADNIVKGRLEEGRGLPCHGILQVKQPVSETELCGHESERIAGGLGCKGRRAAEPGIHLNHPVVHGIGIEGILDIALPDYADMAHYLYGQFPQIMVFLVGESLRRRHYNAFPGVDSERVEVLHVADSDAVVISVPHDFVFNLLPALEGFLDKYLRRERESLLADLVEFLLIVTEPGAEPAEGIGRADNHRIAEFRCRRPRLLHTLSCMGLYRLYIDLVQLLHEQFPVFSVDYSLDRCAEDPDIVGGKHSAAVKFHPAVQGSLSSESQEDALRLLLQDDLLHKIWCDREEVNLVGHSFRSLDGGNVRVDENCLDAFFLQCLECLGA